MITWSVDNLQHFWETSDPLNENEYTITLTCSVPASVCSPATDYTVDYLLTVMPGPCESAILANTLAISTEEYEVGEPTVTI